MRDKLIALIQNAVDGCARNWAEVIADHLLANGVVVIDTDIVSDKNRPLISQIAGYPIDEVISLMQAKAEGNIIVPPCKVGDKVYCVTECSCEDIDGKYTECEFYGYGTDDMVCTIPDGVKCPYQYRIREHRVTKMDIFEVEEFWGKTVFLTREDAERALKESEVKKDV